MADAKERVRGGRGWRKRSFATMSAWPAAPAQLFAREGATRNKDENAL
jgi:hypothetical protein